MEFQVGKLAEIIGQNTESRYQESNPTHTHSKGSGRTHKRDLPEKEWLLGGIRGRLQGSESQVKKGTSRRGG